MSKLLLFLSGCFFSAAVIFQFVYPRLPTGEGSLWFLLLFPSLLLLVFSEIVE